MPVVIDQKAYDINRFLKYHPGGSDILRRLDGTDITELYKSYHPTLPNSILKSLALDSFNLQKPKEGPVYYELKKMVNNYFLKTKKDPKDWRPGAVIGLMLFLTLGASWYASFLAMAAWLRGLACLVAGIASTLIAMHLGHDLSHCALSHSPAVWYWGGNSVFACVLGGSMHTWTWQHVIGHHVHTNDPRMDPDVPQTRTGDIRRVFLHQAYNKIYRFQWLYMPVLYSLLALKIKIQDFQVFWTGKQGIGIQIKNVVWGDVAWMLGGKAIHVAWRLGVPLWLKWCTFRYALGVFVAQDLVMGLYLSIVFQLSHLSLHCDGNNTQQKRKGEWAMQQIRHSVDYAVGSRLAAFFTGGLNMQTAHHLFPGVSQYHLRELTMLIKQRVQTNEVPTFLDALRGHIGLLHSRGRLFFCFDQKITPEETLCLVVCLSVYMRMYSIMCGVCPTKEKKVV